MSDDELRRLRDDLDTLRAEVKRQNGIAESRLAIDLREVSQALAGLVKGEITGHGVVSRSALPEGGRTPMQTRGISPKFLAAIVSAVVTYLVTQTVLELPPGVVLACQVVGVAVATYLASPGEVEPKPLADERGYSVVDALLVVFLALVVLLLLLAVLGRV